jgi:antitoxin HicB
MSQPRFAVAVAAERGNRPDTQRSAKDYVDLPYQIGLRVDEGNGGWIAQVEELPGCEARAETAEQAVRRLRSSIEQWVRDATERGEAIPEPRALSGHSGRLLLRMPQSLHAALARAADVDGISLNQFITTALAGAVGWRSTSDSGGGRSGARAAAEPEPRAAPVTAGAPKSRTRNVLLVVNLIVLAALAGLAVVLLVTAWRGA